MTHLKYLLTFVILSCLNTQAQQKVDVNKKDKPIYSKLMNMNFNKYTNKPVYRFFNDLGYKYQESIPSCKNPGFINHIIF